VSEATIQRDATGRLRVSGVMSLHTVPQLWRASEELIRDAERVEIDLRGVLRSDSAGLALLVQWMRQARHAGKEVRFLNIPRQMLAIARVSSLDRILPLARAK